MWPYCCRSQQATPREETKNSLQAPLRPNMKPANPSPDSLTSRSGWNAWPRRLPRVGVRWIGLLRSSPIIGFNFLRRYAYCGSTGLITRRYDVVGCNTVGFDFAMANWILLQGPSPHFVGFAHPPPSPVPSLDSFITSESAISFLQPKNPPTCPRLPRLPPLNLSQTTSSYVDLFTFQSTGVYSGGSAS